MVEADLCEENCDSIQAVGLDDIRILDGACSDVNIALPDRK